MALPQPYDPYYLPIPQMEYVYDDPNAINTLFVSGLPDDVKAREIHNLFRRRHGFESCQLKYTGRGNQVVAFATFVNHSSAIAALHELNGVKFDPQSGSTLHIELARSNSRRKNKPGSGPYVVIDKRSTAADDDAQGTSSDDGDSEADEQSDPNKPDSEDKDELSISKSDGTAVDTNSNVAAEIEQTENTVNGAQGCSTLFIANLGPNCTEVELKQYLSPYPGFNSIKMRARGGMPVAFADFETVVSLLDDSSSTLHQWFELFLNQVEGKEIEQANQAMNDLQGTSLPSSDRGGMHLEYARSRMRKR